MVKVKTLFLYSFTFIAEITDYARFGPVIVIVSLYREEWVGHEKARRK